METDQRSLNVAALERIQETVTACRKCPRLVAWREEISRIKRRAYRQENYWGKPVSGFGDPQAGIFIVGLAPGAHGSNRTGRQFTGDASGDFLFSALWRAGLANQPHSEARDDGLELCGAYTAPVCRCVPPDNKPMSDEIKNCLPYLKAEIFVLRPRVFVALGKIAFEAVLELAGMKKNAVRFAHGTKVALGEGVWLLVSYHPSQQNTLTGRLTPEMFDDIWKQAVELNR